MKKILFSMALLFVFSAAAFAQQDAEKMQPVVTKQKVEQDERIALQQRLKDQEKRRTEQNKEARKNERIALASGKNSTQTGKQ